MREEKEEDIMGGGGMREEKEEDMEGGMWEEKERKVCGRRKTGQMEESGKGKEKGRVGRRQGCVF